MSANLRCPFPFLDFLARIFEKRDHCRCGCLCNEPVFQLGEWAERAIHELQAGIIRASLALWSAGRARDTCEVEVKMK
jgi:hypothetical protein